MKKIKLILILFPIFLFSKTLYFDFSPCYQKFKFITNEIPVTKTKSVTFNKKNCLYYDEFTGMCVINHKNKKRVNFFDSPKLGWWASSIKKNKIYVGNYASEGLFLTPSKLSIKSIKNSVISDMFCRAIGVGNGDGFIKADLVKHFVNYGYWGDIGIDVDENMNIVSFDPFYVKDIKIGEKIEKINEKRATPKTFTKYILEGILGKSVTVTINHRKYNFKIRKKRYLFTPLSYYGIEVNKNLVITKLPSKIKNRYYINIGAKLIEVNNQKISSFTELKKLLSTYKNVTISIIDQGIKIKIPLR